MLVRQQGEEKKILLLPGKTQNHILILLEALYNRTSSFLFQKASLLNPKANRSLEIFSCKKKTKSSNDRFRLKGPLEIKRSGETTRTAAPHTRSGGSRQSCTRH